MRKDMEGTGLMASESAGVTKNRSGRVRKPEERAWTVTVAIVIEDGELKFTRRRTRFRFDLRRYLGIFVKSL